MGASYAEDGYILVRSRDDESEDNSDEDESQEEDYAEEDESDGEDEEEGDEIMGSDDEQEDELKGKIADGNEAEEMTIVDDDDDDDDDEGTASQGVVSEEHIEQENDIDEEEQEHQEDESEEDDAASLDQGDSEGDDSMHESVAEEENFEPKLCAMRVGGIPTLLHVNRQSRKLALKHYHFSFGDKFEHPIYVNFEKDLFLDRNLDTSHQHDARDPAPPLLMLAQLRLTSAQVCSPTSREIVNF